MKGMIHHLLRATGYRVQSLKPIGREPWRDLEILLRDVPAPVCFDIGAHRGETMRAILEHFPRAAVHAFEPDPDNFAVLQAAARACPQVRLHQLALGDAPGDSKLQKTAFSMSNSLLSAAGTLHSAAHQKIGEVDIAVTTLDLFCERERIETIDLLKTDCQGFDLRVLRGAKKMLTERRVRVLQCESLFYLEYQGQGWFFDILHYLTDLGYAPVSFGEPARNQHHEIMWSDVIFKRREEGD